MNGIAGNMGGVGTDGAKGDDGMDSVVAGSAGAVGKAGEKGRAGANGGNGLAGSGGVGVRGIGNTTVVNDGTISGGLSADGSIRASSVEFTNGGNRLELHSNSNIIGNAVATHGAGQTDTLALGGAANGNFNVSEIGTKYIGFNAFDKSGSSLWTLSGNTTELTPWTVSEGVLSVSSDGNLGDVAGGLNFNGGTLQVTGTGYTSTDRRITIENNGGTFDIVDGAICFKVNDVISGVGGLTKTGAGGLELNAVNTYTGGTQVNEGNLVVGSSAANSNASIAGDATVANGARLAGYGTIQGNLINNGTVAPGGCLDGSIADLRVGGNYVQDANGTLDIDLEGTPTVNDVLTVGGTATIGGSLVLHIKDDVDWYTRKMIVDTGGGVTGVFANATADNMNVDTAVIYDPNQVILQLFRNDVVFVRDAPPLTPNQRAAAGGADVLPKDGIIYRNILIAGQRNAPASFDALSGEIHADITTAIHGGSAAGRQIMLDRMRSNRGQDGERIQRQVSTPQFDAKSGLTEYKEYTEHTVDSRNPNVWAEALYDTLTLDGDGNTATMQQDLGGVYAGANMMIGGGWQGGFALGYTSADVDVSDRRSEADIDSFIFGLTAGNSYEMGAGTINLLFGASRTLSEVDTTRRVTVGGLDNTLTSSYDVVTDQVFGEVGYEIQAGTSRFIEPFLNLAWANAEGDSYRESGGPAALTGSGVDSEQITSILGVRVGQSFNAGSMPARVHGSIGWQHAFGDTYDTATHSFAGGAPFTVEGAGFDENAAILSLGADLQITESLRAGATYTGRFSGGNRNNTLRANLNWDF